ncbi:MAG: lgt [Ilumatobacteraceae bacterium]|nr:lgt [Ilumatobacteraceae bacterium]
MFASIPSPSSGSINIGPLAIHAYGLMIALGVIAAVWLCGRRLESAGTGTREDINSIAVWAVLAGVIGSRLYWAVTDKSDPWRHPAKILRIWEGGLGIPGGLIGGVGVGLYLAKRRHVSRLALATAAAPAIPLAQAIGRWGNYWNQELFGRPTTLPWALRIDDEHLTQNGVTYPHGTTFHPTFLYESLWNVALVGVLLLIERKLRLRPGRLMVVYVLGYFSGRFWIEGLRIDNADSGGGLRLNQWVSLVVVAGSITFLVVDWWRHRHDPESIEPADEEYVPADE